MYVSLDAADKETYRALKGADAFERARQGIRLLADAAGAAVVGVGYLLSAENWRKGERMLTTALDLGADYVQFRPVVETDHRHPDRGASDTAWIDDALPWLESLADRRGVEVDTGRFKMYRDWNGHPYPFCYWAQMQAWSPPTASCGAA